VTEANVSGPRLLAFVALCVIIGPAIGTFVELCFAPVISAPAWLNLRLVRSIVVGGYTFGAPIGLVAAVLFVLAAQRYKRHGLGTAHLAALITIVALGLGLVIRSLVTQHFQPSVLWGIPRMAIIAMVAMTGCWYIARVVGILR
jgi:hypothetical protein